MSTSESQPVWGGEESRRSSSSISTMTSCGGSGRQPGGSARSARIWRSSPDAPEPPSGVSGPDVTTVREIDVSQITAAVRQLCMEICYRVPTEMVELMRRAREREESPLGRQILDRLLENQELAAEGEYPYCQDTGFTVVFVEVGQDVHVAGGDLYEAIDAGVASGYSDGYLRGSI